MMMWCITYYIYRPRSVIVLADVWAFLDTQFSDDKRAGAKCGGKIRDQFGTGLSRAWDKAGWVPRGCHSRSLQTATYLLNSRPLMKAFSALCRSPLGRSTSSEGHRAEKAIHFALVNASCAHAAHC